MEEGLGHLFMGSLTMRFRQWLIEEVERIKVNVTPLQNRCVLNYGDIRKTATKTC